MGNIKGLSKVNPARTGDVMVLKSDNSLDAVSSFCAQVQTLDNIPNSVRPGYCPIGFVRCGRSACKIIQICWKVGKETHGKKLYCPSMLKCNELAEVIFSPCNAFVVEGYRKCIGLSRIAFLEGNAPLILGKIVSTFSTD